MPQTIYIPKRGQYTYLRYHSKRNKYNVCELKHLGRGVLRDIWNDKEERWDPEFAIKPIYVKHEDLWYKVFAIDWEAKEMLIVEETDEIKIPNDLDEEVVKFVRSIIEHNKKKLLFKYYKDSS